MSDIVNFSKYSDELKKYLLDIDVDPLIKKMILEIPEVQLEKVSPEFGIWALVPSIFSYWFIERSKINNAQSTISAVVGKYASIEFMLKGYFAD